jgi:hypothetical protein
MFVFMSKHTEDHSFISAHSLSFSHCRVERKSGRIRPREGPGKSSLTISAKPDGVGAALQLLILRGEQSGLLTRIVTTESVSLCTPMKN